MMGATLAWCWGATAQPVDTLTLSYKEHHQLFTTTIDSWLQNPALRYGAYAVSYGQLSVYLNRSHEHQAFVVQEGNSLRHTGVEAHSYRRLGSAAVPSLSERRGTVVWGEASYQHGRRDNVEWNSSSDWATVYPFVLADTLGGNRKTERYTFRGGCATRFGNWTIGEDVDFRAEHEWSTHDPRMRGVVTDLKATVGVSRRMLGHQVAVGGLLKLYKQTNSVEFYRDEGVVPEYQMSGLGQWYERFSGTNNSAYYKATGWGGDIGVRPEVGSTRRGGLLLTAHYTYTPYKRILSSLNAMPIQKLYVTDWDARLGWMQAFGHTNLPARQLRVAAWVAHSGSHRRGDEIIAGQSTASEYVERGNLTMYCDRLTDIHGGLMMAFGGATVILQSGRQRYGSVYAFPNTSLDFKKNYIRGDMQWQLTAQRYVLSADIACDYYHTLSEQFTPSPSTPHTAPATLLVPPSSLLRLSAGIHAQWHPSFMGAFGLFGEVRAAYLRNDADVIIPDRAITDNKGFLLHTAVGITF